MCNQPARGQSPTAATGSAGAAPATGTSSHNISPQYRPSELQKFILVWTKKYKSKEEIPKFVSYVFFTNNRYKGIVNEIILRI